MPEINKLWIDFREHKQKSDLPNSFLDLIYVLSPKIEFAKNDKVPFILFRNVNISQETIDIFTFISVFHSNLGFTYAYQITDKSFTYSRNTDTMFINVCKAILNGG